MRARQFSRAAGAGKQECWLGWLGQGRGCVGGRELVVCWSFGVESQISGRGRGSSSEGADTAAEAE